MKTLTQNNNRAALKSTDELSQLMNDILHRAKKVGATDASVGVSMDSGFSIDVRMGVVETVAFSEDKSVGVTLYIDKAKGHASSSDTSSDALDAMISAAYEIAKVSTPDPCFGLPDPEPQADRDIDLDLDHFWDLTPEQAIEKSLACEDKARSLDPRIVNSDGVGISTYRFCVGYANTQGFEGCLQATRHTMSCSLVAKELNKESMQRDYEYTTARHPEDLMPWEYLAENAVSRAVSRLGARKIKTQKAPVLFSSRLTSGLMASFISAISGYNLYRKNSFLLDTMGQPLFPSFVQIYERPWLKRGLGSALFDGEGVATRPNIIVQNGVLNQYILSTYTARKLGLKTTANQDGVFNLTVDPTVGSLEESIQLMGRGLLVTELMGQGVNILTGDYSRGASGFWVEDGKIVHPVEEITIAGNLKHMLKNIVSIGRDVNLNSATHCGSILIEEMTIAGH